MEEDRKYSLSYCQGDVPYRDLKTVPDVLEYYARTVPTREAVVFVHTDGAREAVTYGDLYVECKRTAKCFVELGVKKSELVAVSLRTCPQWLYVVFGAIMAGARPISFAITYTDGSDIIAMMRKLQTCSTFVLDPGANDENWNIFKKFVSYYDTKGIVKSDKMPYLRYLICHDKPTTVQNVLSLQEMTSWTTTKTVLPDLDPDDIAILFQTSGSTGIPKAVSHTHASWLAAYKLHESTSLMKTYNDRPFGWIGGSPGTLLYGHTRVTLSGRCDSPHDVISFTIQAVKKEKCAILCILPHMVKSFMQRQDELGDDWPVQVIGTGGQPITKAVASCVGKLCKFLVYSYGSTEFQLASIAVVTDPDKVKESSAGKLCPRVEMKIIDDNGEIVPVKTRGEICIRSGSLFKGYYNDPEKTQASMTSDGWFLTDDMGYMTEDGELFCEGRKSDIIISGGLKVVPSLLESIIEQYSGVAQAVCIPIPDSVKFQVICACVVLENGSDVKEEQLKSYCESVHNDKTRVFTVLPTYFMFMHKLPQTHTGKTDRNKLISEACEYLKIEV